VDVLASQPHHPTPPLGHTNDPLAMYLEDVFTLPGNLAGLPNFVQWRF
jgi:aspartyl-tRNA(Asn)/glutamyl-tRNA(Gln) amidotransferase subunit A